MKKIVGIIYTITLSMQLLAQYDSAGYIYLSSDFRSEQSSAVVIRWAGGEVVYQHGFNIYRKEGGASWQKLNSVPITYKADVDTTGWHPEIQHIYHTLDHMTHQEIKDSKFLLAFLRLDLLRTRELAEATGHQWIDETAAAGKTYQYRIVGLGASGESVVGVSEPFKVGQSYQPIAAPDSIQVVRTEEVIGVRWKIDEARSVSTVVEISLQNGSFEPMSSLPMYVATQTNEKGETIYPDVFITRQADKDSTYAFRFAAVDVFGVQGPYSEVHRVGPVDMTPPLPPQDPAVEVDDRAGDIFFSWAYPDTVADIAGFMVFQKDSVKGALKPVQETLIDKLAREFSYHVDYKGNILHTIGAVDTAGNISESVHIQAQVNDLTSPEMVTGFSVAMDSMGIATLTWSTNGAPDLAGYHIYRYFGKKTEPARTDFILQNVKPFKDTVYVDSLGVKMIGQVRYGIAAVDTNYNKTQMSEPLLATLPDHIAPSAPFIKTIVTTENQAEITWMANVDTDLSHFLLSKIDQTGKHTELPLGSDVTTYTDVAIEPGKNYKYYLTAFDNTGNASDRSKVYEVTSQGVDNAGLEVIEATNLTLKYVKKKKAVSVFWTQQFPEVNLGVVVYRGQSKDDLKPVSGMLRKSEWVDKRTKEGITYCYQLRTYADNGSKLLSDIREIKIKEEK